MQDESSIQFQLGQLTGQVTALSGMIGEVNKSLSAMESRLRVNEMNVTSLAVKMAVIGIVAGGLGSFFMSYILKVI